MGKLVDWQSKRQEGVNNMLLKETYKLQLIFVVLLGLLILGNWSNILTRYTTYVLVSILFFAWIISVAVVVIKKSKKRG